MPSGIKYFKGFFKHTWHLQQMVSNTIVAPSCSSLWDHLCLDQVAGTMGSIYEGGPEPEQDYFPKKNRIPSLHMDNPTFENVNKAEGRCTAGTELSEVKVGVSTATSTAATSTPVLSRSIPCGNGGCKATRSHGEARPESPWHLLKTIFLVSVIVALVIWVIVYTLLAQYRIL